ncbi:TPA: hypothetical protein ACGO1T_000899 [Streptococcus suis]
MKLPYLKNGKTTTQKNMVARMFELYEHEILDTPYYHPECEYEYPAGSLMFWVDGKLEPTDFDVIYNILDEKNELAYERPAKEMYDSRSDRAYDLLVDRRLGIA